MMKTISAWKNKEIDKSRNVQRKLWNFISNLNPGNGIYKAENFAFSPVSSLHSWHSQFSRLFVWRLGNPVYLAQVRISYDRTIPNTGV